MGASWFQESGNGPSLGQTYDRLVEISPQIPPIIIKEFQTLYKDSICYTERWYLEIRRLIHEELWYHPLLNSIIGDINLRQALVKSAFIDGALMRSVLTSDEFPEFHISASVNLKKLNRWCAFFVSLPDSHETLVRLNALTPD